MTVTAVDRAIHMGNLRVNVKVRSWPVANEIAQKAYLGLTGIIHGMGIPQSHYTRPAETQVWFPLCSQQGRLA